MRAFLTRPLLLAVPLWALLGLVASAQTWPQPLWHLSLWRQTAYYAPPPWVTTRGFEEGVEIRRAGGMQDGIETFDSLYIPEGENFDAWSELYEVKGQRIGNVSARLAMERYHAFYEDRCERALLEELESVRAGHLRFVVYCTRQVARRERGEVAVVSIISTDELLVRNSYYRRVPAYSRASLEHGPPMPRAMLEKAIAAVMRFEMQ